MRYAQFAPVAGWSAIERLGEALAVPGDEDKVTAPTLVEVAARMGACAGRYHRCPVSAPSQPETIYVFLLNEGVDCWAPVKAERQGNDVFRLLPSPLYPDTEWELPPGFVVRCDAKREHQGADAVTIPVAVALVSPLGK